MITLVTAVPGSGKTLLMIDRILKAMESGRRVYTNIDGLLIEGVHDAPDDWRDTPEGSLVIYDEAQELFPSNAKPGVVTDERLTSMEVHRHTGHDLVFVTQAPTFIHHHIRKLVGEHIHLFRPNGMTGANIYTWGFAVTDPNDRREQERADHQLWKYPKEHFKLYKSATIHTHKFRVPRKIAVLLGLILCGVAYVTYSLAGGLESFNVAKQSQEKGAEGVSAAPPAPAVSNFSWSQAEVIKPISGCMESKRGCFCYDDSMTPLNLPIAQCKAIIQSPLPRSLRVGGSSDKSKAS
ncbi:MAG: zonular occludens toxin [Inoviridae sp.]|nr:MAG: zonular occludens toxin [Inoviridae sp.]